MNMLALGHHPGKEGRPVAADGDVEADHAPARPDSFSGFRHRRPDQSLERAREFGHGCRQGSQQSVRRQRFATRHVPGIVARLISANVGPPPRAARRYVAGQRAYVGLTQCGVAHHRRTYAPLMKTVLVVDDERNIVELVRLYLEKEGFNVVAAADGEQALVQYERSDPDLVVLDLMLPKLDGFEVCRELRRRGDVPILMLTARSEDVDAIVGLELGADDYVTKPFNPRALVARVKAIMRRTDVTAKGGRPIHVGNLRIDGRRREAWVGDRQLELRAREFDLLAALARDPGVVLSRDALLEDVWGTDFPGETRTVDVHVAEVRKKLGADGPQVETVRGIGYRLVPPPRGAAAAAQG
jgi:two-component system, OmpR family, alkaline phosphatase synthesis response regulator PhoP